MITLMPPIPTAWRATWSFNMRQRISKSYLAVSLMGDHSGNRKRVGCEEYT